MYQKMISLILVLFLALALCACGGTESAAATPEPSASPASPALSSAEPDASAPPLASEAPADLVPALPDAGLHAAEAKPADSKDASARLEQARSFIGKDVQDLIAELGEPTERSYAPSCVGSGEDGELQYEGFTVYTYREGDRETVTDAA